MNLGVGNGNEWYNAIDPLVDGERTMGIHDWTRVSAGTFHDFHTGWLTHIKEALNKGVLPDEFYAQAEQRAGQILPDVLTLHTGDDQNGWSPGDDAAIDAVAVAEAPPRVSLTMRMSDEDVYHLKQKTLIIRHATNHRIVALLEIVSPSNKDREQHVETFVEKAASSIRQGLHFVLLDLLPPGPFDSQGMHGRGWSEISGDPYKSPQNHPLTLASYDADEFPIAYVEPTAVGQPLIPMPLFLESGWYVNLPLQETYEAAYRGVPKVWQRVIEGEAT